MPRVARLIPVALFVALALPGAASADTLTVTTTTDNVPGSLRNTIAAAQPNDTVKAPPGTYRLAAGEIAANKNLTIEGTGAQKTIVDAQGKNRVFNLMGGTYTLRGLTVTGGKDPSQGGGILITSTLALDGVRVRGNRAGGADAEGTGGGILMNGASLTLTDSSVTGNHAGGGGPNGDGTGGGIAARVAITGQNPTISVDRTTVSGNTAGGQNGSGQGAGIDASDSVQGSNNWKLNVVESTIAGNLAGGGGTGGNGVGAGVNYAFGSNNNTLGLTIDRSTISGNVAGGSDSFGTGAGLAFAAGGTGNSLTMNMTNSTVSDNVAHGSALFGGTGGGIVFSQTGGTSAGTLTHVTVAGNTALGSTATGASGGGIFGQVSVRNTIIAGNNAATHRNCSQPVAGSTFSIEDANTCGLGADSKKDTDPKLRPLEDYGGLTKTRALRPDSPAVGFSNFGFCLMTDQRGVKRSPSGCDAGAYELTLSDLAVTGSVSKSKVAAGRNVTFTYKVHNNGPDAALATRLRNTLPAKLRRVAATATGGTCAPGRAIVCSLGTLLPGETRTVRIVVSPLHAGKITNRATVSSGSGDAVPANNAAAPSLLAIPAVLKLSVKPSSWKVGGKTKIHFTLSDAAKVRFAFALCTKHKKNKKGCAHYSTAGSLTRAGKAGGNKFNFKGNLPGGGSLVPGDYRLSASARDSKGNRSPARTALFKLRP